jgi:HPt (histidine-containing phosphotransfer) domain-containing protein
MPGTLPPLDEDILASLRELQLEGEPDLLRELLDLFMIDTPNNLEAIGQAIATRNAEGLRHAAHSAKGSSANLGAAALAAACKELEDLGRSGTTEGALPLLERAESEYHRAVAALEQELAKVPA